MTGTWRERGSVHLIAHRGASAYAPANSPEAVTAARDFGATDVEIDLHSTADGAFVITHDALLDGDDPRWISQLSMDEYRAVCERNDTTPLLLDELLGVVVD
ncbi:MAG: glycerophosphodiester phosphodiesterase family protein, partial [Acidimicrobiia bacterium]